MREDMQTILYSGAPYKGTINYTLYAHCKEFAEALLLGTVKTQNSVQKRMNTLFAALLMHDPLSVEMARAFAETIVHAVLHQKSFHATLEGDIRRMHEICKVFNWGHTYMDMGNAELPGYFFRHVELFLYHVLLEVVTHIGALSCHDLEKTHVTNSRLCGAIQVICTMAKGSEGSLPTGSTTGEGARSSGALLLIKACESVECSILNEHRSTMHRGHVILAMVIAKDAVHNPDRDPLGSYNMLAHLFASGTPLNFLRRAGDVAFNWSDRQPFTEISEVDATMINVVKELDEEASLRRRQNKKEACTPSTVNRQRLCCTHKGSSAKRLATPRELFGDSPTNEDRTPKYAAVKRKAGGCSSTSTSNKLSRNEWMSKYPGVTKKRYWDEGYEESPGLELESVLKQAVCQVGTS
jgi:hypothetical protein